MNFVLNSFLFLWGASLLLVLPVCEDDNPDNGCTEIGCSDGFTLIIQPVDSLFAEGMYEVNVSSQSIITSSCYFRVSNNPSECASGHCVIEGNCNAGYHVGYPYPDRISIRYPIIKSSIQVEIRRNSETILQTNFNPEYEFIQPNGPSCPPVCEVGSKIVSIN